MGNCIKVNNNTQAEEEQAQVVPDLKFQTYSSTYDANYTKIESNELNFFKYFQLHEFVLLLSNFKVVNPNGLNSNSQISILDETLDRAQFSAFVERKILKHFLVSAITLKDENKANLFKEFFVNTFDYLQKGQLNYFKLISQSLYSANKANKTLRKLYLVPIGLIYSHSSNRNKVDFFFNLFINNEGKFEKSDKLKDFLYFLFVLPSTASLMSLNKMSELYTQINKINEDDYIKILNSFEPADILRLREFFLSNFFGDKTSLTYDEFVAKFGGEVNDFKLNFDWIFSPNGIRSFLENNNIKDEE